MRNTSGLGCGWIAICKHCGKEFRAVSHKQLYCSTDCSFLNRIEKVDSGCWEWQGAKLGKYGTLRVNGKMVQAHRYSYEKFHGEYPKEKLVCHKCDNPLCVNPDHLFLGTHYDNNHDRSVKGRSGKRVFSDSDRQRYSLLFRGENQTNAKLTTEQALEIYNDSTLSHRQLAEKYNISKCVITSIKNKRAWKHIHEI